MNSRSSQKSRQRTWQSSKRWIIPFFKQYRGALALALFLGVMTFAFASALMFNSGYLISRAAEAPGNIMVIYLPIALVRIFGVGKPILHYLERLTSHDWILRMTSNLRLKLYELLEVDAIFFKRRYKTGDILGLLAEDIGYIQNLYLRSIFPTIIAWVLYVLVIIFLGFFSLWFALVMLLLLGVVVFLVPLVSVLLNGARQTQRKVLRHELYEQVTDNVLGVSDWIISGRSSEYVDSYRASEESLRRIDERMNTSSRNRDLVLQVLYALVVVVLLVWSGNHFGGVHGETANWIAAFVLGFFPLIEVFAPLSQAAIETNRYRDSIDRLGDLPDKSPAHAPSHSNHAGANTSRLRHPAHAPSHSNHTANAHTTIKLEVPLCLEAQDVSFSYPDSSREVLTNITLSIKPGEKLAILGRSGSGKSTFASLLRGDLSPTQGIITLGGVSTREFGDEISSFIGVIQQQTYLFNTTLADNLKIGNPSATDEELWKVLESVGLDELAKRLPDGLETMVDEAGLRFSGGERHRIALARVLLQQVPIVILDEPTVGLDPQTEQALLKTIFGALKDKTIIMITHHLQGVSLMDRVIFIEDGRLVMSGSPEELEQHDPYYQRLQAFDRGLSF